MSKQHNAFYYFMLDFKSRPGHKYHGMNEVAEAAGPHWKKLSKDQRKVYEERARKLKGTEKLNSDRIPVEEVEKREREEMRYQQQMKDDIMARLAILKRRNALNTHLFFIIHVNCFCREEFTKKYYPCEIGISAFSLQDGVQNRNVFHSMIKPGVLPIGYNYTATLHSKETHQIELPDEVEGEDDQDIVFKQVISFLESYSENGSTDELPILYAAENNLPLVVGVFDQWCEQFGVDPNRLQIYNLQYMFRILRNTVAGVDCWASDTMSKQEIERDVYNYTPNIACEYHETIDVVTYCARSYAVRYGFTICDNCCKDAQIELVPGCHVPENSITTSETMFKTVIYPRKKKSTKYTSDSSSIRDDSSDADTLTKNTKSGVYNYSTTESARFPEYNNAASSSRTSTNSAGSSTDDVNASGSYTQATSSQTGRSGFSKRPAAMPFNVTEGLETLTLSQESRDINFPALGRGRGRGNNSQNANSRGRGRGNPFQRTTSRF